MSSIAEELYTLKDLAIRLGITPNQSYYLVRLGMPYCKLRGHKNKRYKYSKVINWLKKENLLDCYKIIQNDNTGRNI